jgi:AraC-like DNA-binding protein
MTKREFPGSWLLDAFRSGGADPDQLLDRLPRESERLLQAPEGLRPDEVNRILLECARLSHDPHFGLHLIHHIDITSYGAYGYLLLSTPTVRSFLEVAQRYYPTFYRGAELALTVSADGARLEYRVTGLGSASQRHDNEWTLAFFVNFIRSRLEFAWYPRRVKFSNPPPGDLGELRREFGDHILFDQPETSFELEPDILDVRISNSDPRLLAILQQHADELLQAALASDSFEHQVRLVILERLKSGLPSADSIARSSSMSLSTLKRRLRETGLSYRDLRDGVVREVSERLLRETDLSIGAIALEVGYSEHSAFDRAFARLCGMTPLEYRRSTKLGQGP